MRESKAEVWKYGGNIKKEEERRGDRLGWQRCVSATTGNLEEPEWAEKMYNGMAALARTLSEIRMVEEKWWREMDRKVEKLQRSLLTDDEDTETESKEKESAESAEKDADGSMEGDGDVQMED